MKNKGKITESISLAEIEGLLDATLWSWLIIVLSALGVGLSLFWAAQNDPSNLYAKTLLAQLASVVWGH